VSIVGADGTPGRSFGDNEISMLRFNDMKERKEKKRKEREELDFHDICVTIPSNALAAT
jgi:hypothetical protein